MSPANRVVSSWAAELLFLFPASLHEWLNLCEARRENVRFKTWQQQMKRRLSFFCRTMVSSFPEFNVSLSGAPQQEMCCGKRRLPLQQANRFLCSSIPSIRNHTSGDVMSYVDCFHYYWIRRHSVMWNISPNLGSHYMFLCPSYNPGKRGKYILPVPGDVPSSGGPESLVPSPGLGSPWGLQSGFVLFGSIKSQVSELNMCVISIPVGVARVWCFG